jgi:hypothetical protein
VIIQDHVGKQIIGLVENGNMIKLINILKQILTEEIDPSEAYTDEGAIDTVIDGKRDVGFLAVYFDEHRELLDKAVKNGLKYISMPQQGGSFKDSIAYVIYRPGAEEQAMRLAKIARKHGGYIPTETPEETYEIGMLLGYHEYKVKEFVLQKFPNFKFY